MNNFYSSFKSLSTAATNKVEIKSTPKISLPNTTGTSFLSALNSIAVKKMPTLQPTTVTDESPIMTLSLRKDFKLWDYNQRIQGKNECGPTALTRIYDYYKINTINSSYHHNMFPSDTVGHGPLALKKKAEGQRLIVRQQEYGSIKDIVALVDAGIPPLVMGSGKPISTINDYIQNATSGHWIVVNGYKRNELGEITNIYVSDPNYGNTQCWSISKFSNFWENNVLGSHRYFMAMAKNDPTKDTIQEAFLRTAFPGNVDKISSSFNTILLAADALERFFYKVEAAGGDAWAATKKLAAKIANLIKRGVSNIAQEIEKAFNEVYDAVMDALNAIADAAEDIWDWLT